MTPATPRPRLVVLNFHFKGREFILGSPSVTVGRSPECEVFIDQASVSRLHARVEEVNGRFFVRDLNSRNGIRLGDRSVTEAELHHGDVITVGEVQLRFELVRPDSATGASRDTVLMGATGVPHGPASGGEQPPDRPLTSRDILAVAQSGVGNLGPGVQPAGGEAETTPRMGLNIKLIAAIILALVLSIGIGVVILRAMGRAASPKSVEVGPVLIRVGENKWISCRRHGDFDDADIIIEDDTVADARRYAKGEFLIIGKSGGTTTVSLVTQAGITVSVRVLVRGRIENPLEELTNGRFTPEERRRMGLKFLESGLLIETEKPYLALQEYQKAVAVLKRLRDKGELYLHAKRRMVAAEKKVDKLWTKLSGDISVALHNDDFPRAMELLEDASKLIPDSNDPRHQRVQWKIRQLITQELGEKKRKRRGRR